MTSPELRTGVVSIGETYSLFLLTLVDEYPESLINRGQAYGSMNAAGHSFYSIDRSIPVVSSGFWRGLVENEYNDGLWGNPKSPIYSV